MNRLRYIVIHCMLTLPRRWVSKIDLEMWHMGPRDLNNGRVKYRGKVYDSREELPLVKIGGVWVKKLHGRGWDRLGYADLIHHTGEIENVTSYDKDDFVDREEITWGAAGVNSVSRHIALEGGIHPIQGTAPGRWKFEELYTDSQFVMLAGYVNQAVLDHPEVEIIGHYQVPNANKTCPNFSVPGFLRDIGMEEKHIVNRMI